MKEGCFLAFPILSLQYVFDHLEYFHYSLVSVVSILS